MVKSFKQREEIDLVCEGMEYDHVITEAEYQGKKVKLNDPIRTSENPNKKFKVYVKDGDKVKVGVRFMGRQIAHKDLGIELLEKFQAEIGDEGTVEQPITSEGRSMHMILAPPKKRK